MNVATIEIDQATAVEKLEEYSAAVRARHSVEDEEIRRGYAAAAAGRRILTLTDTIRAGGFDAKGRPKLAVARLAWKHCAVDVSPWSHRVLFFNSDVRSFRPHAVSALVGDQHVRVPLKETDFQEPRSMLSARAESIVPLVPPRFRPNRPHLFHVLYEAEWTPTPPKDPALIRHIGGDLWSVHAEWDLTELERAVLGRLR